MHRHVAKDVVLRYKISLFVVESVCSHIILTLDVMLDLEDSHNILNIWKNYFHQLLNVHDVNDTRHTEIYTAESLVP